jgi:hypothetical protein
MSQPSHVDAAFHPAEMISPDVRKIMQEADVNGVSGWRSTLHLHWRLQCTRQ